MLRYGIQPGLFYHGIGLVKRGLQFLPMEIGNIYAAIVTIVFQPLKHQEIYLPMATQQQIITFLLQQDKRLKPVIERCRFPRSRKNHDIYHSLLSSIVSQQLSVKAADTIFKRFIDKFDNRYPEAEILIAMDASSLRSAGLSQQKIGYVKNVAAFALHNNGLDYHQLKKMSDDQLLDHLTQIKGVGRWTVEMLLMFAFDRKDVFACDDLGIQQSMRKLYRLDLDSRQLKTRMLSIADRWRPYRSVVCKYLWQWKSLP